MASVLDTMGYDVPHNRRVQPPPREWVPGKELTQTAVVLHGPTYVGKTEVLEPWAERAAGYGSEGLARHRDQFTARLACLLHRRKALRVKLSGFYHQHKQGIFIVECESSGRNLPIPP